MAIVAAGHLRDIYNYLTRGERDGLDLAGPLQGHCQLEVVWTFC